MKKLFGTDGVRGTANREPMTPETALRLGRAAAYVFKQRKGRHRIVIGKDTRLSGYMLESALESGISSMGVDVLLVGPMPTPALAFLVRSLLADAAIVISGSHNPFDDNGIKFFSRDGFKLPDAMEQQIEDLVTTKRIDAIRPTAHEIGKAFRVDDAEGRYIEFAKNSLPKGMDFEGMKVVVDCANGAAYQVAPTILRELGADVTTLSDQPNGTNINEGCGALHPEACAQAVRRHRANVGVCLDGDADRAIFITETGRVLNGDRILAACALDLHQHGRLKKKTLVTTVMSNFGLDQAMRRAGITTIRTGVGDRYVLERMRENSYSFGGEQSGHVIFLDHNTTGDGVITTLQVLSLMRRSSKPLSRLASVFTALPQVLIALPVTHRIELSRVQRVKHKMDEIERRLNGTGRLLVRYSGTEPVLRILVEGEREREIRAMAKALAATITRAVR